MCAEPEAPKEKNTGADADSASSRVGKAIAGAAVTGLYTGLKFTGLAVRVASGLAASIGKDAEKALSRAEAGQGAGALARVSHVPARLALRCHGCLHLSRYMLCWFPPQDSAMMGTRECWLDMKE